MLDDAVPSAAPQTKEDSQITLSVGAALPISVPSARQLPATIGRYRVLRLLGEGGMGSVYEAEQEQPNRKVALKVIKTAWASPDLIGRFARESQALGRLHHSGIAQIYEAGTADSEFGVQPYFAMELIHGKPLDKYADAHHLNTRQRLMLMMQICDAVQHAHQRGIIHRDLKPSNILVDENGHPKILDFGVARVTDSDAQATRQTDMGELLGTLAYMSPEQVLADPLAVDTRSDVYSLGVILYELLAGKLPYTLTRDLIEAVHTIREQDPVPLSSLSRVYRGDVESIVAKALEKDKARRYASAADLAEDIRRYLEDEPIAAKPPSATYQLQKFARRHKALVVGVAAVFVVLVAGVIASTREASRARSAEKSALAAQQAAARERDRAVTAETQAEQDRNRALASEEQAIADRNLAVAQKKRADTETATADAVNGFLQNDLLAQASASNQSGPSNKPDPDLKVRTALDRAAQRITGKFDKQPEVEASIRDTMGQTYSDLGLFPEARKQQERALELFRRVLGDENLKTLETMDRLGATAEYQGKYAEAQGLYSQSLEIARRVLGPQNPETLVAMDGLASTYFFQHDSAKAELLYGEVLEARRRIFGPEHPLTLRAMTGLASTYSNEGKVALAEELFTKIVEARQRTIGPEHPDTLNAMANLAGTYQKENKIAKATALYSQTLELQRRVLGPEHPKTVYSLMSLANIYLTHGKYEQAQAYFSQALEIDTRVLGLEHYDTLYAMHGLAVAYNNQGNQALAEPLFAKCVEIMPRVIGKEDSFTLVAMDNLSGVYLEEGKYAQAEALYSQTLEIRRRVSGPDHFDTATDFYGLATTYEHEGKYAQAEAAFRQSLEIYRRLSGPDKPYTVRTMIGLAGVYVSLGKFSEGETLARDAVKIEEQNPPDNWRRFYAEILLGASLAGEKKYAEAEPILLDGYQGSVAQKDRISTELLDVLDRAPDWIVRLYTDWGKPEKAAEWQQRILAQKSPPAKQQ